MTEKKMQMTENKSSKNARIQFEIDTLEFKVRG